MIQLKASAAMVENQGNLAIIVGIFTQCGCSSTVDSRFLNNRQPL
ncbi:hypothetical protein Q4491_15160 [Photobacterium sp. 2_MG-2023]|nr:MULTISPECIES: hypothetical protein [Photobacterium]MDO6582679.1 hypothetical protein [Photobacterium sp. 2_MG-2023]